MKKTILITAGLLTSSLAFSAQNYVVDSQLTEFRSNVTLSDFWVIHEDSKGGLGDVSTSGDTAFGAKGSARMRFKKSIATHDFSAKPGLSQVLTGLPANTEMSYSLYYCDQKGPLSPTSLYYGVREVTGASLTGKVIAEKRVHVRELNGAPKADKKRCFRQVSLDFNSGTSGNVEIFSLMEVDAGDTGKPDMSKDMTVRIDEFSVVVK